MCSHIPGSTSATAICHGNDRAEIHNDKTSDITYMGFGPLEEEEYEAEDEEEEEAEGSRIRNSSSSSSQQQPATVKTLKTHTKNNK